MDLLENQPASPLLGVESNRKFLIGLARAAGGAIIFGLPMLLTMEMWWLGFYMDRLRLALFILVSLPLLVGLSHFVGFEDTFEWKQDLLDAFVACAVGFLMAAIVLPLIGVITLETPLHEVVGKLAIQAIPGSFGALLARSQMGEQENGQKEQRKDHPSYLEETFLMLVGALFLGLTLAPTQEVVLVSYQINEWRALALAVLSIVLMHAFIYSVHFKGQTELPSDTSIWSVFVRFTLVGYAIVLLASVYILWTFERTPGTPPVQILMMAIVLGFPGAVGAAAARLLL